MAQLAHTINSSHSFQLSAKPVATLVVMQLVITMGNPQVSHAVPAPVPVATHAHAGLPIKTAKTVKN